MKLLILGAAGKTGRELVRQALAAGHEVRAFVRDRESLAPAQGLEIITGDAEAAAQIQAAAKGCDAVISALGHTSAKHSTALTSAMQALVATLAPNSKVISLTGFGVYDPKDPAIPFLGRLMNKVIELVPGGMFSDGAGHVRVLRESSLDWTVIRAPRLTLGQAVKTELGYFSLSVTDSVPRASVAAVMIDCLDSDEWSRKSPMIRTATRQ
jgi:uncharacterized protein YbjT (DUF2867 family)